MRCARDTNRPSGARAQTWPTRCIAALIDQERPSIIVPEIEAIATETLVEIERDGLAAWCQPRAPRN